MKKLTARIDKWGNICDKIEEESEDGGIYLNFDEYLKWYYVIKVIKWFQKLFGKK